MGIGDATSLFVPEGDAYLPTALATGPWSAEALHGGPPAALLAREVERHDGGEATFVTRITFELLRPVPVRPLAVRTTLLRPGKKVQLVQASLSDGDREVMRATGLRLRRLALELPGDLPADPTPAIAGPAGGVTVDTMHWWLPGFHTHGVEHRFAQGAFEIPGPAADWIRLRVPVLPGEVPSPLCRACAAADFGNGVSGMLRGTHTYVNPDLTVYLHRYPRGEWVGVDAITRLGEHGNGVADTLLRDEDGPIGRSVQSLIIEPR